MSYFIYILTNDHKNVLYIGVTNDLTRRLYEHKNKVFKGFTTLYNVDLLIYYEIFDSIDVAILREKQLKKWSRSKKVELIEKTNPNWETLNHLLFSPHPSL